MASPGPEALRVPPAPSWIALVVSAPKFSSVMVAPASQLLAVSVMWPAPLLDLPAPSRILSVSVPVPASSATPSAKVIAASPASRSASTTPFASS